MLRTVVVNRSASNVNIQRLSLQSRYFCDIIENVMNNVETVETIRNKYTNSILRVLLGALCCALWGSAFPGVKLGYQWLVVDGTGSQILFAGYRFTIAGILTFLYGFLAEREQMYVKLRNMPMMMLQGMFQTCVGYIFFYIGLYHMTGSKSSIINSTQIFFSLIFVGLFMRNREKLTYKKWIACVIGFAGVVVVNIGSEGIESTFSILGDGFILLAAISFGVTNVTSKWLTDREGPVSVTAFQLTTGGLAMIIIGLLSGGSVTGFNTKGTILFIYLELLSTVAFIIWTKLLKYNEASKISVYGFMTPVFGVLLSGLFLGETILTITNLVALILVSIGVIIANRD